jgi:hypothetical protein
MTFSNNETIFSPLFLSSSCFTNNSKRKKRKLDRKDPVKSKEPWHPTTGTIYDPILARAEISGHLVCPFARCAHIVVAI